MIHVEKDFNFIKRNLNELETLLEIEGLLFYPIRKVAQEAIYECSSLATLLTGAEAELRVANEDR